MIECIKIHFSLLKVKGLKLQVDVQLKKSMNPII